MAQYSLQLASASNQYATGGDYANAGTAFTVAFWMKTSATGGQIIHKIYSLEGWEVELISNKVRAYFQKPNTDYRGRLSTADLNNNAWRHIVYTYNGTTATLLLYVDGSPDTGTPDSGGTPTSVTSVGSVMIGANATPTNYFNGAIDDVRLWTRILSAAEVTDLYTNPCTFANGTNLEAWWKLDNGYTDSSGNNRTLTASGSPTFSSADVPYATCPVAAVSAVNSLSPTGFIEF